VLENSSGAISAAPSNPQQPHSPVQTSAFSSGALNQPVFGVAATPDGGGYWLVAADGGIFSHGSAQFFGSTGSLRLNRPIVGMASTTGGRGYWLVASDGGVFAFGDASFHGSTGGMSLNRPIVGMAATADGNGYWLVASDGGVFAFGDASFHGSTGGMALSRPIVGMVADRSSGGYWMLASDGGVFAFDAPFYGSAGGDHMSSPMVGMAARSDGNGYWLAASDATVKAYAASPGTTTASASSSSGTSSSSSSSSSPSSSPPVPSNGPLPTLGVNLAALRATGAWWKTAFGKYAQAGSSWVRVDVPWPALEPSPGAFSQPFLDSMDYVVANASSRGMGVLFVVLGTPAWDQPADRSGATNVAVPGGNLPPVDTSAYAGAMAEVAGRFAGQNVAWELWNEPNSQTFFSTRDPGAYARLACGAYRAIKSVAPNATVAAGALSQQDPIWLARSYAAGLHGCFDVLSIHPYDQTPVSQPPDWQPPVNVATARQVMIDNGDGGKSIWITEFGWSADPVTTHPLPVGGVTLAEQASYTAAFLHELAAYYPYVTTAMIFNGVDNSASTDAFAQYAGILTPSLVPKPVYDALASLYKH
jgi:hypothetical protein